MPLSFNAQDFFTFTPEMLRFDIDGFLHANDLSYTGKPEEELKKYKKGQKLKVKIIEINKEDSKVRVGLKQLEKDPFDWFKDKNYNIRFRF